MNFPVKLLKIIIVVYITKVVLRKSSKLITDKNNMFHIF